MSLLTRRRLWTFFEALYAQEQNESSPKVLTPEWVKTPLLPHQQTSVAAALALEKAKLEGIEVGPVPGDTTGGRLYTSYGIFGDRVGSGKSLTALSLVKAPPPPSDYTQFVLRGPALGEGRDVGLLRTRNQLTTAEGITLRPVNTCLFIIPHALISQWETYVENDTTLKALFVKKRQDAASTDFLDKVETFDAIFVSSTMWTTLCNSNQIHSLLWKRVFIDEADSVSVNADMHLYARFYWFISASWLNLVFANGAYLNITNVYTPPPETPLSVIERVTKLQGTNYLQIPGCRHLNIVRRMCGVATHGSTISLNAAGSQSARIIIHNSEDYIKKSFETPAIKHRSIICATPANIRVLDSFISPDMMERLNAGDLHGALDSIGMSAHTETEISEAVTASMRRDLENARRTYEFKKTMEYSTDQIKQKALEACEQRIASIESRITAIDERIKKAKEQTCPICYCDVNNPAVTPCCQQLFCFPCLCESLKRVAACPLCRTRINDLKEVQVVGEKNTITAEKDTETAQEKLPKKDAFVNFVKENPTAKILMFSGYDATFAGIEDKMTQADIKFATVNGSNARINKLLRDFKAGKYNVLFLNARNMGAGLNIEFATHVVLFHCMAAELETQIIGRAMRLGRKDPLDVVHLLHETEGGNRISHA